MKTINQSAQEHDVHPIQVRQWKRDIQAQAKTLFEGKRGPKPVSPASSPDRRSFCFRCSLSRFRFEYWRKGSHRKSLIQLAFEATLQSGFCGIKP